MERDASSGNDYDHARYDLTGMGRFLAIDNAPGSPKDPLSWNRYAYARDNPLTLVDRNGMWWSLATTEPQRAFIRQAFIHDLMKPSFRARFLSVASNSREVNLASHDYHNPSPAQLHQMVASGMQSKYPLQFAKTGGMSGGGLQVNLDVAAIKGDARFTSGLSRIDPQGQTTVGHEAGVHVINLLFHPDLVGTNPGQDDYPTSDTGPAQQYGSYLYNTERSDNWTAKDAAELFDSTINKMPCGANGQTKEGAPCKL